MASVTMKTQAGKSAGKATLDDAMFGIEPNMAVMHQVVTAQLAAKRAGTHSTLTRREVRGGGAKPWRQKGTGRARAGSSNVPNWRGGGVAHGPKPRDYSQRTPKKMVRLALSSALSDRATDGNVIVVDQWSFEAPKTSEANAALAAIGAEGKVLIVLGDDDMNAWKSFRNLTHVHCLHAGELNTYDVLDSDVVVFTEATLPTATAVNRAAKRIPAPAATKVSAATDDAENAAEDAAASTADDSAAEVSSDSTAAEVSSESSEEE